MTSWSLAGLANGLGMLFALQLGYLAGLSIGCVLSRVRDPEDRRQQG